MSSVGIRELKTNTSEIVRRVREQGEVVEITHRGEVVARLIPARPIASSPEELDALWADMDRLAEEKSARIGPAAPARLTPSGEDRREL